MQEILSCLRNLSRRLGINGSRDSGHNFRPTAANNFFFINNHLIVSGLRRDLLKFWFVNKRIKWKKSFIQLCFQLLLLLYSNWLHRSARFCCWKAMGCFRSNFWCRIRIRNQNQPITSGFWDIWGYVLEKWGFNVII